MVKASPVLPMKPTTSPALDSVRAQVGRRVAGEVRVVELVADAVSDPEAPAAELLPADAVDRAVRDGDDRRPERREDVVAVMPVAGDITAEGAVGVDEVGWPDDREDVVVQGERRCDLQRLPARGSSPGLVARRGGRAPRSCGRRRSLRCAQARAADEQRRPGREAPVPLQDVDGERTGCNAAACRRQRSRGAGDEVTPLLQRDSFPSAEIGVSAIDAELHDRRELRGSELESDAACCDRTGEERQRTQLCVPARRALCRARGLAE